MVGVGVKVAVGPPGVCVAVAVGVKIEVDVAEAVGVFVFVAVDVGGDVGVEVGGVPLLLTELRRFSASYVRSKVSAFTMRWSMLPLAS